jgi:8-amino-7-oxononanoate synthase
MIDFTSSLYLSMKHSSDQLLKWQSLTTGAPAALYEVEESRQVANDIAQMQGLDAGISAPSTLHLYLDLFGYLSTKQVDLFVDENIYPVSKYGIERLIVNKIKVYPFKHLNSAHLFTLIKTRLQKNTLPIILTDGWCPKCGKAAPIKSYSEMIKPFGGKIIIDDTQAFGIFGERNSRMVYGSGGGGILRWSGVNDKNIITVISLAKAFGVPMAVVSGNARFIQAFENAGDTRVYSSPVSIAHLVAAINALKINSFAGDERRNKLWSNLSLVRNELKQADINSSGGIFPVQSITGLHSNEALKLHSYLKTEGIQTVLTWTHENSQAVTFIVRCDHSVEELKRFLDPVVNFFAHEQTSRPLR